MATVPVVDGNMRGGFTVVTHVTSSGPTAVPGITNVGNVAPSTLYAFVKGQPKVLGAVQIMIGVVTLMFGIVLVTDDHIMRISVLSGIVYWGSVIYIITGALAIAAEKKINSCLVKGSLGMNVVSAVTATAAIGVFSGDFTLYYCSDYNPYSYCYSFEMRSKAISAVLLVLSVLELTISVSISAFGCKATCDNNSPGTGVPGVPGVPEVNPRRHGEDPCHSTLGLNPRPSCCEAAVLPTNSPAPFVTMANPAHTNPQVPFVTIANPAHTPTGTVCNYSQCCLHKPTGKVCTCGQSCSNTPTGYGVHPKSPNEWGQQTNYV